VYGSNSKYIAANLKNLKYAFKEAKPFVLAFIILKKIASPVAGKVIAAAAVKTAAGTYLTLFFFSKNIKLLKFLKN
jgi:hypothetical protein